MRERIWSVAIVPMLVFLACSSDVVDQQTASTTPTTPTLQSSLRIPEDIPDSPLPAVSATDIRENSHRYGYGQIVHVYGEMVELYQHGGECYALLEAGVSLEYKSCDSLLYWEVGDSVVAICTMGQFNPRAQGDIAPRRGYHLTHNCDTPSYIREAQSP